jgi:osmotically inducible protein OsmC
MPTRTAHTEWNGGLNDGTGKVQLVSSGAGTFDVSFPRRTADEAGGVTSPEELIAAAHTSCYCMQLSGVIGKAGGTPKSLVADAEVSLGPDPAGGLRLTGIALRSGAWSRDSTRPASWRPPRPPRRPARCPRR